MFKENIEVVKKALYPKRLWNSLLTYTGYAISNIIRKPIVLGFPPVVMIEPTNICNLRCPLCPSGNQTLKRDKGFMSYDNFTKVIDQIYDKSSMLILWNQGEPFLNKDFCRMISYASSKNLYTLVSTNGNLDVDPYEIVKSGLKTMIVSLDGATQETYNKYRINGELDKVLSFVKALSKAKKELKSSTPLIKWQFIVMKHNEHELDKIQSLAEEVAVDNLALKSVQIYEKSDIENFLPKNPKYRRYKINGDNFELKYGVKNFCQRIWTRLVVNWNGEVSVCCFDKDIDFPIGNIKDNSLNKLWKNQKFQNIRDQILKDRSKIEMCRNCGEGVKLRVEEKNV